MFSQTTLTTRRNFLERSMWGFGSAFLLPSLLTSCTDHIIPPPDTPVTPPLVGDYEIDWNDAAKTAIAAGLGYIPVVGGILGALVSIFWPNDPAKPVDVWAQVKERVESLVNQKISDLVYQQVTEDLQGLINVITRYQQELKAYNESVTEYQKDPTKPTPDPKDLRTQWLITVSAFVQALPHFQSKGYEVPLLGLFVQFVNMYLSVLRDGVVNGKNWGRSDADQQQDVINLQTAISDSFNYTQTTYTNHVKELEQTPRNDKFNQPFATVNRYTREMTLVGLDYMNTWAIYDVTKYPHGAKVLLPRELYSDPLGQATFSGLINLVLPVPTKGPSQLTVWGDYDGIHAVQATYPTGSGPGGVTTTPRMGVGGGSADTSYGGKFTIAPTNPIVSADTIYNNSVFAITLKFLDGTQSHLMGRNEDPNYAYNSGWVGIKDHLISRVHINGMSEDHTADCVVYGFLFLDGGPTVTPSALHALYVTSPQEPSVADFAQAFPALGITDALITDELKAARQAHWASIKARAEALK